MKRRILKLTLFLLLGQMGGCHITDHRGSATVCEVHSVVLKEDIVPCHPGFFDCTEEYGEASRTLFPRANDVIEGPIWGDFVRVRYCPDCRAAKKAWIRQHKVQPNAGTQDFRTSR